MKPALILTAAFIPLMIAYMAFLAQRDQKLFERYELIQQVEQRPRVDLKSFTPKEQFCKSQAGWHSDCNVE